MSMSFLVTQSAQGGRGGLYLVWNGAAADTNNDPHLSMHKGCDVTGSL